MYSQRYFYFGLQFHESKKYIFLTAVHLNIFPLVVCNNLIPCQQFIYPVQGYIPCISMYYNTYSLWFVITILITGPNPKSCWFVYSYFANLGFAFESKNKRHFVFLRELYRHARYRRHSYLLVEHMNLLQNQSELPDAVDFLSDLSILCYWNFLPHGSRMLS